MLVMFSIYLPRSHILYIQVDTDLHTPPNFQEKIICHLNKLYFRINVLDLVDFH